MASTVEKISIALPPEMVASVRKAVDGGEYSSSSEVVREALRDWSHKRKLQQNGIEELRSVWAAARAKDGPYVPAKATRLGFAGTGRDADPVRDDNIEVDQRQKT